MKFRSKSIVRFAVIFYLIYIFVCIPSVFELPLSLQHGELSIIFQIFFFVIVTLAMVILSVAFRYEIFGALESTVTALRNGYLLRNVIRFFGGMLKRSEWEESI